MEINQLVEQIRSWLDSASISVVQLHERLTPDHFTAGAVPELRRLRDLLSGEVLPWDLVEAVADVCFPKEPVGRAEQRLQAARDLWQRARVSPTPLAKGTHELELAHELLAAKDRTIEVYQELQVVRHAYETSERSRAQALQIATLLFAMLGQAQAKVAELKRRVDALQVVPPKKLEVHTNLELRLSRAQRQQNDLRQQLARAQQERDTAQQVADHAARRIQGLEAELTTLREWTEGDNPNLVEHLTAQVPQSGLQAISNDDADLDDVDLALQKARVVLDEEHDTVQQAAQEMGYRTPTHPASRSEPAVMIVPAQLQHRHQSPSSYRAAEDPSGLSQITRDNHPTSSAAAPQADGQLAAAELASRSTLDGDRTALYGREAYIADELQRTMLPETLPRPTGVRLASRYLPAAETARVGGDWYDAIPLPGSRVALVVGDVMGHSMTSAAIMGQLRTTAQTLAGLDLPPQEVLHHLDEQAQRLGSDRMATCLYAVYDPVSHRITIANAGHPPPVLLHLGGRAEVLRVPPGAPIGVGGVDFEAVELDAPAGATLLLYTDGLVESRLRDVWTGIEQLRERLAATAQLTGPDHPPPLEALCDEVLDMLGPGDRDDDIALLAARLDGIAPSDVAYWFLEPEDATPSRARRLARSALVRWGLEDMTDSVELLVSEVVTNAVRYASLPVTLRLLRTDVLRCEVGDDVPQLPRLRQARATDEGGRGLYLVNFLSQRWGAARLSTGKVVWFELQQN